MKIPRATYRLQFHHQFTFSDAEKLVGYLARLGISDIYASPILKAREKSMHGYDVVDPNQINPQLGGEEGFRRLVTHAQGQGLGWLQDIVPNHMAFDSDNRLLMDILENGRRSQYYSFFDIQWNHPYEHLKGKLLAPFLGDLYGRCLDRNEIKLHFDSNGFNIRYYDWKFPLKIESYTKVLASNLNWFEGKIQREEPDYIQFLEISHRFKHLSESQDYSEHYNQLALLKAHLWKLYLSNSVIKAYIDSLVTTYNGIPGDSHSLNKLDEILSEQLFKLSFWKVGNEELNYRRFFTINGLLSVRVEAQEVFEYMHNYIFQFIKAGQITGLRIDHIDGLYDPIAYINKLKQREPNLYITVEKILDISEQLPDSMPVQGTTGYDFMNVVNGIFIDRANEKAFDRFYVTFTGQHISYRDFVGEKKKYFMGQQMAGDIDNLAHLLKQIINGDRYGKDMTMYALRRAIVEIMAQFPVYRAYMGTQELSQKDKLHIKEAIASAENKSPGLINELNFIAKILLLEFPPDMNPRKKEAYYHFTNKFQQFSGALMAKGAEDTAFYVYNRFISLNEVGGDPAVFGLLPQDFHAFMQERQQRWPYTMNATSTHDTKRGEDVRARLNVLSEIPKQWEQQVIHWSKLNKQKKKTIGHYKAPDRNDEYFIYQTLIGVFPFDHNQRQKLMERMKIYVVKALREAKVHTNWMRQDIPYEEACIDFIDKILSSDESKGFLASFLPFQQRIAMDGIINSLSQTLLKLTCPGVADFYQGCELWDLSMVDPDNRQPVDYGQRQKILSETNPIDLKHLMEHSQDGRIKFFLIHRLLKYRQEHEELFLKGEYIPLYLEGPLNKYILAFARKWEAQWSVTIVPRFRRQFEEEKFSWDSVALTLPPNAPAKWEHVLTKEIFDVTGHIPIQMVFKDFPVAFLSSLP